MHRKRATCKPGVAHKLSIGETLLVVGLVCRVATGDMTTKGMLWRFGMHKTLEL